MENKCISEKIIESCDCQKMFVFHVFLGFSVVHKVMIP